jgi:hypothetical protein
MQLITYYVFSSFLFIILIDLHMFDLVIRIAATTYIDTWDRNKTNVRNVRLSVNNPLLLTC